MARDSLDVVRFLQHEQRYTVRGSLDFAPEIMTSQQLWEAWLNTITSFAFEDRWGGHCTIRKERLRRGDAYWYAYRSIRGRTKKRYLGKTNDLTLERLEEVSALFRTLESAQPVKPYIQAEQNVVSVMPLLETKLYPPQLAVSLVERPRLLERLDACLVHKLMIVLAPAGSGKTTQVNQWLAARSSAEYQQGSPAPGYQHRTPTLTSVAWVSLDAGDNDPFRFWRYMMTGCQKLLGQERRAAGQIALSFLTTATALPFNDSPIDMAVTHLLNALAAPSSGGLLVLDDYHVINEARIHEKFAFFIEHLPTTVHVLLLSRAEPELPLLRWRARGDLSELHGVDLRFSIGEAACFLHQTLPVEPSAEALGQIEKALEGWAAGLRLLSLTLSGYQNAQTVEQALLSLGKRADFAKSGQSLGMDALHRNLLDYFVSEILEAQPESIQRFLLQTSVLGRLCAPLCDAVTASEGSGAQLEAVARAGLFLEAMIGSGGWYRYHALFADAMRREASRRLGEEELRTLSERASYWYEQEALWPEAIDAVWLTRDMGRAARLIEQFNEQHFYEPYTILHWLERLPEAELHEHPILCLLFATELNFPAWIRFPPKAIAASEARSLSDAEHERIEKLLRMAEDGWRSRGEFAWLGSIWAHRALGALLYQDSFSSVVNFAQQALTFLPQRGTLDLRLQMYRSTCLLFVGTEKLRLGQVHEAQQMLLQAQEDNAPRSNKFLAIDIHLTLGKSYLIQGESKLALRYLSQALSEAREANDNEVIADALLELAWLNFELKNLEATEQQTREALEAARSIHPPMQELYDRITLQFALLQHVWGETQTALEQLREIEARPAMEWTPRSFWLASRLRDWQERLRMATQRAKGTGNGTLIEPLSVQEERVLQLLVAGWSNQDIARELIISVNTVKYHIKHIYQKLGVNNRLQASEAARHLLTGD